MVLEELSCRALTSVALGRTTSCKVESRQSDSRQSTCLGCRFDLQLR